MWFIDQLGGSVEYHMPNVLHLRNKLDRDKLEKAFRLLIDRHEVLRTMIKVDEDGSPYQVVVAATEWEMGFEEWEAEEAALAERTTAIVNQAFDLAQDFKLRAHLLRLAPEHHVLVLVVHHIASDGWSQSILVNDLVAAYQAVEAGETPPWTPLDFHYADYAIWQRQHLNEAKLASQLRWWEQQLAGIEPLRLPTDFPRPAVHKAIAVRALVSASMPKPVNSYKH